MDPEDENTEPQPATAEFAVTDTQQQESTREKQ